MIRAFGVRAALALLGVAVVVDGCGDDDDHHDHDHDVGGGGGHGGSSGGPGGSGGDERLAIALEFEARVGDEPFACTSTYAVGTAPTTVMPLDFKLYVHDVELLTREGSEPVELDQDGAFQNGGVALLDFEDDLGSCGNGTTQTHTTITGSAKPGDYTGIAFKVGVPEDQNHGNQAIAPSPLNLEGMFWSWTTGYKFLRIDVMAMGHEDDVGIDDADAGAGHAGGARGFLVHLGSTMCSGNPAGGEEVICQRANRPEVRLTDFEPSAHKIVVDLAALLEGSNVAMDQGGQPGCMSGGMDPECPAIFEQLGLDLATGEPTGNPPFLRVADK
jgi:uncharacterized repeat protein (TIGR04052 family)